MKIHICRKYFPNYAQLPKLIVYLDFVGINEFSTNFQQK